MDGRKIRRVKHSKNWECEVVKFEELGNRWFEDFKNSRFKASTIPRIVKIRRFENSQVWISENLNIKKDLKIIVLIGYRDLGIRRSV